MHGGFKIVASQAATKPTDL